MTDGLKGYILCINCGSSSLKFSLYRADSCLLEVSGQVSRIGQQEASLEIKGFKGQPPASRAAKYTDFSSAVRELIAWLKANEQRYPVLYIGHRLVQGGPDHRKPEHITVRLLEDLRQYIYLAPNHLPDSIKTIEAFLSAYPAVPQLACFDTSFHSDIPSYARNYPLPAKYREDGLFKYGFHGLSYGHILEELTAADPDIVRQKIIIAHLGNGASLAAVREGKGVDTTMGISPIGGLVMGTRSGDLDPGVLLFLMKRYRMGANQLENLLSKNAGLLAIAGTSDVQQLLQLEPVNLDAKEALRVFCYNVKKHIGALAAALDGLDLLIFTGGIGENAAIIRERICLGLEFMGIELEPKKNRKNQTVISKTTSRVNVRVIKTNEELMMARLVHAAFTIIKN